MISHIGDIDGMGSPIIASLIYPKLDIILSHVGKDYIDEWIKYIEDNINKYEKIFICDLPLTMEQASILNTMKDKIFHFDHHISNIESTRYSFSTVLVELNDHKTCGTELFYDNQKSIFPILNNYALSMFVELIRSYDTWDWQTDGTTIANDLTTLFEIIGPHRFIKKYVDFFNSNPTEFTFSKEDLLLIELKNEEKNEELNKCHKTLKVRKIDKYNVGMVVCERYQSIIGNRICTYNDNIDYIMLLDLKAKKCSLRTVKDVDVSEIAKSYGGGGHVKAASFAMTNDVYNKMLDYLKE